MEGWPDIRRRLRLLAATPLALIAGLAMARGGDRIAPQVGAGAKQRDGEGRRYLARPLVTGIYAADPSAHVFDGRSYVYPSVYHSRDVDAGIPDDDLGTQYAMHDYRIFSTERPGGAVTAHPVAIDVIGHSPGLEADLGTRCRPQERHLFETAWLFMHGGRYHFTYSTGDTHFLA